MPLIGSDAMDFRFTAASKGEKKPFNIDRIDIDFNLDEDFDNLSSFKVDLSDLDLQCPSKNPTKTKETPEGNSSTGNLDGLDCFDFSFDFNGFDQFVFDSPTIKGEKASLMKLDSEISLGRIKCRDHKTALAKSADESQNGHTKDIQESDTVVASIVETDNRGCFTSDAMQVEQCSPQIMQSFLPQSLGGVASVEGTLSCALTETEFLGSEVNMGSRGEHNGSEFNRALLNSSTENVIGTEQVTTVSRHGNTSTSLPWTTSHCKASTVCNLKEDLFSCESGSHVIDETIQSKEKSTVLQTEISKRTSETESQFGLLLSTNVEASVLERKGFSATSLSRSAIRKRISFSPIDKLAKRKLVSDLNSVSRKLAVPTLLESKVNVKSLYKIRHSYNKDDVPVRCKPVIQRQADKEAIKNDPIVIGTENDIKYISDSSGSGVIHTSLTDVEAKINAHTIVNSKIVSSTRLASKVANVKRRILVSRTPDLSSLKIARDVDLGFNISQSHAMPQQEIHNLKNYGKRLELLGKETFRNVVSAGNDAKIMPAIISQKHKSSDANQETPDSGKHLSLSPKEISRNFGHSERIVNGKEIEKALQNARSGDARRTIAEAYGKDLDDICAMLEKKSNEAQQLLVRAIMNKNKSLMLNHPIFEAKIRTVLKFYAHLSGTAT